MGQRNIYRSAAGEEAIKTKYDEWLRQWPLEKQKLSIETRHGQTQVIASGDPAKPPLLLLHGAGTNSVMWLGDVQQYAASHRVYAVEIIGEANHSDTSRPPLKMNFYSEWLHDVLAGLGVHQAAFVGASLGAWICLAFASYSPERVSRLVLISPAGVVPPRGFYRFKWALATLFLGPYGRRMMFRRRLGQHHLDPRLTEYSKLISEQFRPRPLKVARIPDKALAQLYCPILLIVGGQDQVYNTHALLLRLATRFSQLHVEYRPNEGHHISDFTRSVDRFLLNQFAPDSGVIG